VERCQACKQRSQRNPTTCAIVAWVALFEEAKRRTITVDQVKERLLTDYLRQQLTTPTVSVCP